MSSYLSFRKNDVDIVSFSRNTKVYQAFPNAPYDEWKPVTADKLRAGIEDLRAERDAVIEQKKIYERMAANNHFNYDDLYQLSVNIQECEEEIEDFKTAISNVYLLVEIAEEYASEDRKPRFEWCVG